MRCPACATENPEGARFCNECGQRLEAPPAAGPEAERRQLTVVFCDLMGSTALSGQVDPEELRELMTAYQASATDVVQRFGGHTAMFLGDGILTYFGYPKAHEDDVERAVRAALGIVGGIQALNEAHGSQRPQLAVRVAAHTGDVVVGELEAGEGMGIFGETPNLAARLQSIAPRNGVVISEATQRLVHGLFRVEDLGAHELAGVPLPVGAFLVHAPSGVRGRLQTRGDLSPFVGRHDELELLRGMWADATREAGRAALISGDAGIGKSRLVRTFREGLADTVYTWLECGGSPYTRDSAFAPVIELQAGALRFSADLSPADKLERIAAAMRLADLPLADTVPYLAHLHSIDIPPTSEFAGAVSLRLSPEAVRRRTKDAARDWLLQIGRQQPVVLLVEDLHWVDPSSLELIGEILQGLAETNALVLLTTRPEFEPPWPDDLAVEVPLSSLDAQASAELVSIVAGERAISESERSAIVEKTDGIPLFVEEMTRAAVESAASASGSGGAPGVPDTLKGLLMARIDRLGPAKEIAQLGATIGREFSAELLRAVRGGNGELGRALRTLTDADLVDRRGESVVGPGGEAGTGVSRETEGSGGIPATTYVFRHALIQEAAYDALLKSTRARYHGSIGTALEREFPETAEQSPELLGYHFTQAGEWDRAIPYWQGAGELSAARSANVETERHLRSGLECVQKLPPSPERSFQELIFRTRLGANLISVRGYGAEEVHENISRAQQLCDELGDSPLVFPVVYNLWVFHLMRSEPVTVGYAEQLREMAERDDPERLLMWANVALAITHYWQGHFAKAREHAVACREHYRPDPSHIALFGDDPGAYGYVYEGLPAWFLGYPETASNLLEEAKVTARSIGYAFTVAGAEAFHSQLCHFGRDVAAAAEVSMRTIGMSSEQHFPVFLGSGLAHQGWSRMQRGELDGGFEQVQQGVGLYGATGAVLNLHYFKALMAEAHLLRGERSEGLGAADEGLAIAADRLDAIFVPELHRLRGELLLLEDSAAGADPDGAEAEFGRALELAEQSGARSLELRAACSLARLLSARGRRQQAGQRLGAVYDAYPEKAATTDLSEARELLDALAD